jgi:PadR family transcriptional regulator PadR
MKIDKSLLSGSTPMLILLLLSERDMYGYEMVTELSLRSDDTFHLKEGTLYPLLHTMEKNKWVTSYTTQAPNGRDRKYYRITSDGREQLAHKEEEWRLFSEKVSTVLGFSTV